MTHQPPTTFDRWMDLVDRHCYHIAGISVYDLPDCLFADWHSDGLAPLTAARRALKRSGYRS
ncbi:MAG TPA: hypothetical protein VM537_05565 [Anaerolineae bacterium]|nr:hypothetical protein [Anaerolineae bacterium]